MKENFYLYITKVIKEIVTNVAEKEDEKNFADFYSNIAQKLLKITGHLPKATSIARGAAVCSFQARLAEAIGAAAYIQDKVKLLAGKGDNVHKILALTSLRYFLGKKENLDDILHNVMEELKSFLILRYKTTEEENADFDMAKYLFEELLRMLDFVKKHGIIEIHSIFPIVEQTFVDYDLHMTGVPDLILEDTKNRTAIVVDWKTSLAGSQVSEYEKAQVIAYSLMEANRLGYLYDEKLEYLVDAIMGKIEKENCEISDIKVLPIIIRPTLQGRIYPHPIFITDLALRKKETEKFHKMIYNVLLEAQHLTLLLVNPSILQTIPELESYARCPITFKGNKVSALRFTPLQLPRGKPRDQSTFPCVVGKKRKTRFCFFQGENGACKFYFSKMFVTKSGVLADFDKTMWRLRFGVLEEKEKALMAYKGLYVLFKEIPFHEIKKQLINGKGFIIDLNTKFIDAYHKSRIKIKRSDYEKELRFDIISKIEFDSNFSFIGRRKLRKKEIESNIFEVINPGKTILVFPFSQKGGHSFHFVNCFARVCQVDIDEKNDIIEYSIDIPSSTLNFSMRLFKEYHKLGISDTFLLLEIDFDLTQTELRAIDVMQRALREEAPKEFKVMNNCLEEAKKELEIEDRIIGDIVLEGMIGEVIKKGYGSKREK